MYPEKGNMGKVLPEYLSNWTTEKVKRGECLYSFNMTEMLHYNDHIFIINKSFFGFRGCQSDHRSFGEMCDLQRQQIRNPAERWKKSM